MGLEKKLDPCRKAVELGNKGRPIVTKLLKPFGVLWGISQVESNSIETSDYAFEDTCQIKVCCVCQIL